VRDDVVGRARDVLEEIRGAAPDWDPLGGFAHLSEGEITGVAAAVGAPCPVLGTGGECRAHEDRPSLCRLQGLPWRDAADGSVLPDFCRLDPRQESLRPAPLDLASIRAERAETAHALRGDPRVAPSRTCVAAALVRWVSEPTVDI
jgi:Fe-S-cluster containining protein